MLIRNLTPGISYEWDSPIFDVADEHVFSHRNTEHTEKFCENLCAFCVSVAISCWFRKPFISIIGESCLQFNYN